MNRTAQRREWAGEVRVALFAFILAVGAFALLLINSHAMATPVQPWGSSTVALALILLGFALAETKTLDVEINHQTHSQSLTVVPLAFATLLLSPVAATAIAILGASVGLGLAQYGYRRFSLLKFLWNLSLRAAMAALAVLVVRQFIGPEEPSGAAEWTIVLGALLLTEAVSLLAVPLVISAYDKAIRFDDLAQTGPAQVITVTATCFAVTSAAASFVEPLLVAYAAAPLVAVAALLRLHGRLGVAHRDLDDLHRFTMALEGEANEEILARLSDSLKGSGAALVTEDSRGFEVLLVERGQQRSPGAAPFAPLLTPIGTDLSYRATRSSHPQLSALFDELDASELLAMPLSSEHETVGAVLAFGRTGLRASFTDEELALFHTLGKAFAARVLNVRLANRDHLTGLPDREAFVRALDRAVELHDGGAVIQVDLVRFREINESLGHAVGDKVLVQVANRLCRVVRSVDLVARLGSDEFAVLIDGTLDRATLARRVDAMRDDLRAPVMVDDISFDISLAVGASRWPVDGTEGSQLLARAEIALNRAKKSDADFVAFDESFDVATPRRLALAADLRAALDEDAMEIHLQPKVDLATGRVVGAEALARWTHPDLGPVPPVEFIPLVEQAGLVGTLTRLVLARAIDTAADLVRVGLGVPIAVNLAPRDLLDPTLPANIGRMLAERDLSGAALEVEITEGAMVVDFETSVATLHALRARGIKVGVDDFGTGYSSLTYLHRLPVDCLKIDRSFIKVLPTDPTAAAIVRSSIRLAHDLGLCVVAEGIEDDETLGRLTVLGCDQAQGYLLAKPMPAAVFLHWMIDHHADALPSTQAHRSQAGRERR